MANRSCVGRELYFIVDSDDGISFITNKYAIE